MIKTIQMFIKFMRNIKCNNENIIEVHKWKLYSVSVRLFIGGQPNQALVWTPVRDITFSARAFYTCDKQASLFLSVLSKDVGR
jgi:hypothetical protein